MNTAATVVAANSDKLPLTATSQQVVNLLELINHMVADHFKKNLPNLTPPVVSAEAGKRYIKLIKTERRGTCLALADEHQSVYGFIDSTNGDVLKAASWKAPAKHARSNVFGASGGFESCNVYGIAYLR